MCASNRHGELFLIQRRRIPSPLTPRPQQIVAPGDSPAVLDNVVMTFTENNTEGGGRCLEIPLRCLFDGTFDVGGCLHPNATLLVEWAIQHQT